jgi:hypothetical protein
METIQSIQQLPLCLQVPNSIEALQQIDIGKELDMRKLTANDLVLYLKSKKLLNPSPRIEVVNDFSKNSTMFFQPERSMQWQRKTLDR